MSPINSLSTLAKVIELIWNQFFTYPPGRPASGQRLGKFIWNLSLSIVCFTFFFSTNCLSSNGELAKYDDNGAARCVECCRQCKPPIRLIIVIIARFIDGNIVILHFNFLLFGLFSYLISLVLYRPVPRYWSCFFTPFFLNPTTHFSLSVLQYQFVW